MKCRGKLFKQNQSKENHPNYITGKSIKQEYVCKSCGNIFESAKGYDSRHPKYCSRICQSKGLIIEKPIKKCKECGKDFQVKYLHGLHFFCSNKCSSIDRGKKLHGIKRPNLSGKNSPLWMGGITPINELARKGIEYRDWRISVFERDNYTCQICKIKGGKLNADHIKSFAHYPELRFDLNNGRTLCVECHRKTDNYGSKAIKR